MNSRYLEIDSTYRDRNSWPLQSDFVVPISQTGRKDATTASDPVCLASPEELWVFGSFNAINPGSTSVCVTIDATPSVSDASDNVTIIATATIGELQTIKDYYIAAVATETTSGNQARILFYTFLGSNGTVDRASITFDSSISGILAAGDVLEIKDPSDLGAPSYQHPLFFIPDGRKASNSYPGTYLYNQTKNQSRQVNGYGFFTHLLSVDTSGSSTSTTTSGPIDTWGNKDTYSIRSSLPILCTSLDGDISTNPTTHCSFNLNSSNILSNIDGSFLEVLYNTEISTLAGATSVSVITLNGTSNLDDDFYIGCNIHLTSGPAQGEFQTIIAYTGSTQTAIVSPGFTSIPTAGDSYKIICPQEARRIIKYVDYRDIASGGSINTIEFPSSASSDNGYYNNLYIVIGTDIRLIESYVVTTDNLGVTTRIATVYTSFSGAITSGTAFTITSGIVSPGFSYSIANQPICILQFSYDNLSPFVYTGSLVSQQEMVCYEIELLNLVLPNVTLSSGGGGRISFYPYVYVELQNVDASSGSLRNIIYSNNPNSTNMLFRCAVDDVPNPVNSTFVKIDSDGCVQTIKFKPNDNLKFSVRMSNGELFTTLDVDTVSPEQPNPLLQISALFSIKRLS